MKKIIKGTLIAIGSIVFLLILTLALHPLWIGPAIKVATTKVAPTYTGTPLALEECDINLYAGRVVFGGFALSNPEGCADKTATSVKTLRVLVDVPSLATDVIVIKEITLTGIYASYLNAAPGKTNFDVIADNAKAATGGDKPADEVEVVETAPEQTIEMPKDEPKREVSAGSKGEGKKVIIEKLTFGDLTVSYYGFPIPVPGTIVLTNIGKDTQGVSWQGAGEEIIAQLQQKLGAAGTGVMDLGAQGLDLGTAGVTNALEAVKAMDLESAKTILNDTGKDLKNLGKDLKGLGKGLKTDLKGLIK